MLRSLRRATTVLSLAALRTANAEMSSAAACETPLRTVPFVLYGVGGVGAALLENIVASRALHESRYGIAFSAQE